MTKRILSVLFAILLAMTVFVACDKEPVENNDENNGENTEVVAPVAENAEELLTKAYKAFAENLAPSFDMPAEDIISRLKGIRCGFKNTSCPDQLAQALESILANN